MKTLHVGMPKGLLVQPRALSRLRTDFRFCQVRTRLSGHGCTDPNRGRVTAFRVTCNQGAGSQHSGSPATRHYVRVLCTVWCTLFPACGWNVCQIGRLFLLVVDNSKVWGKWEGLAHSVPTSTPLPLREGRQVEIIWRRKLPPSSPLG